jgi:hypothetical protein
MPIVFANYIRLFLPLKRVTVFQHKNLSKTHTLIED